MTVLTEGIYLGDIVKQEAQGRYSREAVTVLAGSGSARVLDIGAVLGRITKGAATGAAVAGNTGNGTITASPTVGLAAQPGVYRAVAIEPATDLGKFLVSAPDGVEVGVATVGTAFTGGGLTFTIADGSTDFVSGDSFIITVAAGSGKVKAIDFAATDGSDAAVGVLIAKVTAPDGVDATGVAIVRQAVVAPSKLAWPSGATTNQKAAALAQLKALGIITREEA